MCLFVASTRDKTLSQFVQVLRLISSSSSTWCFWLCRCRSKWRVNVISHSLHIRDPRWFDCFDFLTLVGRHDSSSSMSPWSPSDSLGSKDGAAAVQLVGSLSWLSALCFCKSESQANIISHWLRPSESSCLGARFVPLVVMSALVVPSSWSPNGVVLAEGRDPFDDECPFLTGYCGSGVFRDSGSRGETEDGEERFLLKLANDSSCEQQLKWTGHCYFKHTRVLPVKFVIVLCW